MYKTTCTIAYKSHSTIFHLVPSYEIFLSFYVNVCADDDDDYDYFYDYDYD